MRKFVLMVGLVVVGIACSNGADMIGEMLDSSVPDAGAETPGDGTSMQYVGNSTQTFNGYDTSEDGAGQGIFAYYAACQQAFGPAHRMCTREEIIFTTKIPQLTEGNAWYSPETRCRTSSPYDRPAVTETGLFRSEWCGGMFPIACCGPK